MQNKIKLLLLGAVLVSGVLFGISHVSSLSSVDYQQDVFPDTDSVFYNGTSTLSWRGMTTDELCLSGDTCRTTWPAGGGGVNDWGRFGTTFGALALRTSSTYPVWIDDNFFVSGTTYMTALEAVATSTFAGVIGASKSIDFTSTTPSHKAGRLFYSSDDDTLSFYNSEADITMNIGEETWSFVRNETGSTITDGTPVYLTGGSSGNKSLIAPAQSNATSTAGVFGLTTHDIENNTNGYITVFGKVRGLDTSSFSEGDMVFVSSTSAGSLTNITPAAPNFPIEVGRVTRSHVNQGIVEVRVSPSDVLNGMVIQDLTINNDLIVTNNVTTTGEIVTQTKNVGDYFDFYNGTFLETFNATSTSDGSTVTQILADSASYTGGLTMRFSTGDFPLVTPTSTVLTVGSDTSPTKNYTYIPISTKSVTISTSGWPSEEHIKVDFSLVPSAALVQSDGEYINQNHNDHAANDNGEGHLTDIAEWIRKQPAKWFSGVDGNGTDGYLTPTAGNVEFISTEGIVSQLHDHPFPVEDTSVDSVVFVKNWSGKAFQKITNLYDITHDSTSSTIGNNKFFNLTFWGVANKTGQMNQIMVNLPSGSYNSLTGAKNDSSGFNDDTMPREFDLDSSVGFLIARVTIQMKTGGGTWIVDSTVDCRQGECGSGGGIGVTGQTTFPDSGISGFAIFDETTLLESTYQLSGLSANREITMPDADGTMCLLEIDQTFSGLQTFNSISSTLFSTNQAWFGETATSTFVANGDLTLGNDLFLGSGGKIDFNSDMTITHSTDSLSVIGGDLLVGATVSRTVGGAKRMFQIESTSAAPLAAMSIVKNVSSNSGPTMYLGKSRSNSFGGNTIVQDGDQLGTILWTGADGTDLNNNGAFIRGYVDGTPGSNDIPGRLAFVTYNGGSATEWMTIRSNGLVDMFDGLGVSSTLKVAGDTTLTTTTIASGNLIISPSTDPFMGIAGALAGDTTSNQLKFSFDGVTTEVFTAFRYVGFGFVSSTWGTSTTIYLAPADVGETWSHVKCETDTGTLNVSVYDGTNRMDLLSASSTVGKFNFSTNNTFDASESRRVDIGTPASSPTLVACKAAYRITAD